jgi:hypothetical protein
MASGFQPLSGPDCPLVAAERHGPPFSLQLLHVASSDIQVPRKWPVAAWGYVRHCKSRMCRASERVERRLLECLAERWMHMNHAADVLEPSPNLDREREHG